MPTVGERELLMRRLQRRYVAVLELERIGVGWRLGSELPLRQVEAGCEADVPGERHRSIAVEAQAALAPGARDDQSLDEVALHAVEVGWLVMLIDESEGHQEQTAARAQVIVQ